MKYVKRSSLNASEVAQIRRRSNGYIWAVLDTSKNTIAIGDEYLIDLRDALIYKYRSRAKDLFGIGLDLATGEIYYAPVVNRINKTYRDRKDIPLQIKDRIETMVAYYFEKFAPFRTKTERIYQTQSLRASSC